MSKAVMLIMKDKGLKISPRELTTAKSSEST